MLSTCTFDYRVKGVGRWMTEWHGTAPSACAVLLMVSPLRGDLLGLLCYSEKSEAYSS